MQPMNVAYWTGAPVLHFHLYPFALLDIALPPISCATAEPYLSAARRIVRAAPTKLPLQGHLYYKRELGYAKFPLSHWAKAKAYTNSIGL